MVPFITGHYEHRSHSVGVTRTVNLYPEVTQGGDSAKSRVILIGTPGSAVESDLSSISTYGCRGLHYTADSRLFSIYGGSLIEITSDGNSIERAKVTNLPESPVYFADDGTSLLWADGVSLRGFSLETNSYFHIAFPVEDYRPSQIVYVGSRFVVIDGTTNTYYYSEVADPRDWRALNSATAQQNADPIMSIVATQSEIWLMGEQSYEVHRLSANVNLPYQYAGGSASNIGCGAARSVAVLNNTVFFLGGSTNGTGTIYASNGYNVNRISNHAIEYAIGKVADTRDAVGFTYTQEGHQFYVLTFMSGDKTIVYDLTTGMFHERATRDALLNIDHRWAPIYAAFAYGNTFVGNLLEPQLMSLSLDKYSEWDDRPIVRTHQSPIYWDDLRLAFHREFQLDIETGIGTINGQGINPQVSLQYSDDAGNTWSSELWTSIGTLGAYQVRCRWRRLGRSRDRVYRVVISDPVKVILLGAKLIADPERRR